MARVMPPVSSGASVREDSPMVDDTAGTQDDEPNGGHGGAPVDQMTASQRAVYWECEAERWRSAYQYLFTAVSGAEAILNAGHDR
jgi:hypothetical protein